MTIDGTNISEYGLSLFSLADYYNLPARKKILTPQAYEENDIVFEPRQATVTLFGSFPDLSTLYENILAFMTKIKSDLKHDYILIGHDENFTGVVAKGIKVQIDGYSATLKFTITIT